MIDPAGCDLMAGTPGRCAWDDAELPPRRRRWCGQACEDAWRAHHWWTTAREAALRRDQFTCVRCGFVGWHEAARRLRLPMPPDDAQLHQLATTREQWAVALGLITPEAELWAFTDQSQIAPALAQLPEGVELIRQAEQRFDRPRFRTRYVAGTHELEVNHIEPRRGAGYQSGCHHHQDNLETLCRPCHQDETNRQRRGLPSWREAGEPFTSDTGHQGQLV